MNAWSMLYDELIMSDEKWVKENGGYEYTPPIYESPDGGRNRLQTRSRFSQ